MDIRPFIGRLEGEELDKQLAEADGFVDFGFSPAMIEKAPKLQIAASGGVGFNGQDVVRESMGDKSPTRGQRVRCRKVVTQESTESLLR